MTDVFFRLLTEATNKSVRVEFTPNMPPTPLVYGIDGGKALQLRPGSPPVTLEDVSLWMTKGERAETLHVRTGGWAIDAAARLIWQTATPGKKQVDLSFAPLRDPLAPNAATGKVVAPHGLIGQSFDGDNIAIDGKKDHCAAPPAFALASHCAFSTHSRPDPWRQIASCGGGRPPSRPTRLRPRRRRRAPSTTLH